MSLDARRRVWAASWDTSTKKLAMLTLAEYADRDGFCWPSVATIASHINQDVDYTHRLMKQLIASGDLLHKRGGGRGRCSIYCVVVGLSDEEKSQRNTVLQSSVIQNNARVIGGDGELSDDVTTSDRNTELRCSVSVSNTAPQNTVLQNTVPENSVLESSVFPAAETVSNRENRSTITDPASAAVVGNRNTVLENTVLQSPARSSFSGVANTQNDVFSREIDHDHDDDDDDDARAREKTQQTTSSRQPAHVSYLYRKGMKAAHLFAHLDSDSAIRDFDNRMADGWDTGGIVNAWRIDPPRQGAIYERQQRETAENQPERSAAGAGRAGAARGARTGARRPDSADRYKRRSS